MNSREYFVEYEGIIDDWDNFQEKIKEPAPQALRVNGWKSAADNLWTELKTRDCEPLVSPYFSNLYYWNNETISASQTISHWAGYYYIQDPVTLLPVKVLAPVSGECVLDLCAAPGGKTFYISELVGPEGTVVANDSSSGRLQALQSNLQRLGVPNVIMTAYDGQSVPETRKFSAVLVDAPCSGEGSGRYHDHAPREVTAGERSRLMRTQYLLLKKAARLVETGGRVVYSTCTFSPMENEAVVDRVVSETELEIAEVELDLPYDQGVSEWQGEKYSEAVKRMLRCYPQHYDGGGMVIALLRKGTGSDE